MNFTTFNNQNNYLTLANVGNKRDFMVAAAAFLKAGDHIGHAQAYGRAHPGQAATLADAIWTGKPAVLAGAPLLAHLTVQLDNLWKNTIKVQGEAQRVLERTARQTYWTTGAGVNTFPTLEEYVKQGLSPTVLDQLKISKIHLLDYTSLLEVLSNPFTVETVANKYNKSHKQANSVNDPATKLRTATDSELLNHDGAYKKDAPKWTEVESCANFWIQEFPAIAGRLPAVQAMNQWAGNGANDKCMRLVSSGEKDFVQANHILAQGPTSFERHKWIFFGNGSPGVGHACKLTMTLKGAAIQFLMSMAVEVSNESQKTSNHALIKKENEKNCLGIHEDLLKVFCDKMVTAIAYS